MNFFKKNCLTIKALKRFQADRKGGVAIMAGFAIPIIFLGAGGAIDYNNAVTNTQNAQRALDATVLALAGRELQNINIQVEGERLFRSILQNQRIESPPFDVEFTLNRKGVSGAGTIESSNFFLGLLGMDSFSGIVESVAVPVTVEPIEIALVLDVSGSMSHDLDGEPRIDRLKQSVNLMFDTLERVLPDNSELSASLVPYSSSVNMGDYPDVLDILSITGEPRPLPGEDVWVAERVQNQNGTNFQINDASPVGRPIPFINLNNFDPTGQFPERPTIPRFAALTSDISSVRAKVNALVPEGFTAGHLGMSWGVYSLSQRWANVWPEAPRRSDQANKIIVLLSDGRFNRTFEIGDRIKTDRVHSEAYFEEMCQLAEDRDITVYTIALNLNALDAAKLEDCVGSNGEFFPADSASELGDVFETIARRIGKTRLTG